MIVIANMRYKIQPNETEWAIVASNKKCPKMIHHPELAPSWKLFQQYLHWKENGNWNYTTFKDFYLPVFFAEFCTNATSMNTLYELLARDKCGEVIVLKCFCGDECLCHRILVGAILHGYGADVVSEYATASSLAQYKRLFDSLYRNYYQIATRLTSV